MNGPPSTWGVSPEQASHRGIPTILSPTSSLYRPHRITLPPATRISVDDSTINLVRPIPYLFGIVDAGQEHVMIEPGPFIVLARQWPLSGVTAPESSRPPVCSRTFRPGAGHQASRDRARIAGTAAPSGRHWVIRVGRTACAGAAHGTMAASGLQEHWFMRRGARGSTR